MDRVRAPEGTVGQEQGSSRGGASIQGPRQKKKKLSYQG